MIYSQGNYELWLLCGELLYQAQGEIIICSVDGMEYLTGVISTLKESRFPDEN